MKHQSGQDVSSNVSLENVSSIQLLRLEKVLHIIIYYNEWVKKRIIVI
jgi:hypothetical protein